LQFFQQLLEIFEEIEVDVVVDLLGELVSVEECHKFQQFALALKQMEALIVIACQHPLRKLHGHHLPQLIEEFLEDGVEFLQSFSLLRHALAQQFAK